MSFFGLFNLRQDSSILLQQLFQAIASFSPGVNGHIRNVALRIRAIFSGFNFALFNFPFMLEVFLSSTENVERVRFTAKFCLEQLLDLMLPRNSGVSNKASIVPDSVSVSSGVGL